MYFHFVPGSKSFCKIFQARNRKHLGGGSDQSRNNLLTVGNPVGRLVHAGLKKDSTQTVCLIPPSHPQPPCLLNTRQNVLPWVNHKVIRGPVFGNCPLVFDRLLLPHYEPSSMNLHACNLFVMLIYKQPIKFWSSRCHHFCRQRLGPQAACTCLFSFFFTKDLITNC